MFEIKDGNQLYLSVNKKQHRVTIKPCFPRQHPDKFLSITDENGHEQLFIDDLNDLDESDKQHITIILESSHQRITVSRVLQVRQVLELRIFEFETSAGLTLCYTRLTDWPVKIDKNDYLVVDIHQDEYLIQPNLLDKKSLKRVMPFL